MKIALVNTGISKSSAPFRLCEAMNQNGVQADLLVIESQLEDSHVHKVKRKLRNRFFQKIDTLSFGLEERVLYRQKKNLPFSFYRTGINIVKEKIIQEADFVILNWICGNFISPYGIKKLIENNKRIILFCHDNWHFTGGCHVRMGCERFMSECGECPELGSKHKHDCSNRMLDMKRQCYQKGEIVVVSPSSWMNENVTRSAVLQDFPHYIIPNALDTNVFRPMKQNLLREKLKIPNNALVIAFGAVNAVSTPYKGYKELKEALTILERNYDKKQSIEVLIFGSENENAKIAGFTTHYLGLLSEEEMVELYNCADIYVVPSLEDSFNYTVAESLACETPVVAFCTGGIVDIIDHKVNGYLARYRDTEDLAQGIQWVLGHNKDNYLGKHGRDKIINNFSYAVVAKKITALCEKIVSNNRE